MKIIGLVLIFFGIAIGMYAFAFNTSLEGVNNLGLLNDKQNILFVAGVLSIMGSIFVAGAYRTRMDWRIQNLSKQSITEQKP